MKWHGGMCQHQTQGTVAWLVGIEGKLQYHQNHQFKHNTASIRACTMLGAVVIQPRLLQN